jgi:hypothetical protein
LTFSKKKVLKKCFDNFKVFPYPEVKLDARSRTKTVFVYVHTVHGRSLSRFVGIFGKQWDEHHRYFATEFHEVALSIISTEKSDVFAHIFKTWNAV